MNRNKIYFRIHMLKKVYRKLSAWLSIAHGEDSQEKMAYPDIYSDTEFMELYYKVKDYTMVGIERNYALYNAMRYLIRNGAEGQFAECGVWKGGSCMLMCFVLMQHGITDRHIFMYDTFEGMTKPGENDGEREKQEWSRQQGIDGVNQWCMADLDEVRCNMISTGYPIENIHFVKGRVEATIPSVLPSSLLLLRLDTDWYSSTRHELEFLYPLLKNGGVLIIDDYGAWPGAKKAVDEYFANTAVLLHRIDETGRIVIKSGFTNQAFSATTT